MGWSSGGDLMDSIIGALKPRVSPRKRRNIYTLLIDAFEQHDCDVLYECVGCDPEFDKAFNAVHPPEDGDDY